MTASARPSTARSRAAWRCSATCSMPALGRRILIGNDLGRPSYWRAYGGGPGLDYVLTEFRQRFLASGFTEAEWTMLRSRQSAPLLLRRSIGMTQATARHRHRHLGREGGRASALDGTLLAEASRPYPNADPASRLGRAIARGLVGGDRAAPCRRSWPPCATRQIVGVGLSGQLNGFVLLDAQDRPLGNAIIWLDTRAAAEADELRTTFGDLLRERAATELNAITATGQACLAREA